MPVASEVEPLLCGCASMQLSFGDFASTRIRAHHNGIERSLRFHLGALRFFVSELQMPHAEWVRSTHLRRLSSEGSNRASQGEGAAGQATQAGAQSCVAR